MILSFDPKEESQRIVTFLKKTFSEQKIENAVIGLSGGIDSATSFYLIKKVLNPEHIFVAHLSYFPKAFPLFEQIVKDAKIPAENIYDLSIKDAIDSIRHSGKRVERAHPESDSGQARMTDQIRLGNIMARVRMIFLYDLAKKHNALVIGTENRSEHLLGYFTRFGDEASDIEPIRHLYKTQIYELAKYLGVPKNIIEQKPTAGLWHNQTDEEEFGFTYKEADQVLFYYFEQKLSVEEILKKGLINAEVIIKRTKENDYKHKTPYVI